MKSNDADMSINVAFEILLTKKRPVVVLEEQEAIGPVHLERIFVERVELAQANEKIAGETETLLYISQKASAEPNDFHLRRFTLYLFGRWCKKYVPNHLPADLEQIVLDEIELLELKNIRKSLYDESLRLMEKGITTPGLDSIV